MGRGAKSPASCVLKLLLALWAAGAVAAFFWLLGPLPEGTDAEAALLAAEAAIDREIVPSLCLLALVVALWGLGCVAVRTRPARRIRKLSQGTRAQSPEEFFRLRNGGGSRGRSDVIAHDFAGIYILTNVDEGRCYVGQATHVMGRVNQHFTGKGNGDVYADYVQGKRFTIRMIALKGSGYRNLDAMERDAIAAYGAYETGYNRTRGNRPS